MSVLLLADTITGACASALAPESKVILILSEDFAIIDVVCHSVK